MHDPNTNITSQKFCCSQPQVDELIPKMTHGVSPGTTIKVFRAREEELISDTVIS